MASGLLYVYTKPANSLGLDAWYFTAIDVPTGRTVFSKLTGVGTQFNNHYAAIYPWPGRIGVRGHARGMLRIRDTA